MDGDMLVDTAINYLFTVDDRVKNLDALDYGLVKWSAFLTGALWGAHLSGVIKRRRLKLLGLAMVLGLRPTMKMLLLPSKTKK